MYVNLQMRVATCRTVLKSLAGSFCKWLISDNNLLIRSGYSPPQEPMLRALAYLRNVYSEDM